MFTHRLPLFHSFVLEQAKGRLDKTNVNDIMLLFD